MKRTFAHSLRSTTVALPTQGRGTLSHALAATAGAAAPGRLWPPAVLLGLILLGVGEREGDERETEYGGLAGVT